ncbi:MAG: hypothetical protein H0V16_08950 [Burkholderiaceae bacterium]|nr:hypothetical protein [Burkholderiaceae bacterium]
MILQGQYEIRNAEHTDEIYQGASARYAVALLILTTLTFIDATPRLTAERAIDLKRQSQEYVPSACGAEAVARAQKQISNTARQESATAIS